MPARLTANVRPKQSMVELAYYVALLSPLFVLAAAVNVFLRRRAIKNGDGGRSVGLFILGFFVVGVLFYMVGFLVGSHISCKGAKYAECVLGGVLLGGPLSLTVATSAYLYFWAKNGKAP